MMSTKEVTRRVSTVYLEALVLRRVCGGERQVVEEPADIGEFRIDLQPSRGRLEGAPEEYPAGMVEQGVVRGFTNQRRRLGHELRVGNADFETSVMDGGAAVNRGAERLGAGPGRR